MDRSSSELGDQGPKSVDERQDNSYIYELHDVSETVTRSRTNSINTLVTFPNKLVGRENISPVLINGAVINSLIDTGSQVSLISKSLYDKYFSYVELKPADHLLNL